MKLGFFNSLGGGLDLGFWQVWGQGLAKGSGLGLDDQKRPPNLKGQIGSLPRQNCFFRGGNGAVHLRFESEGFGLLTNLVLKLGLLHSK